MLIEFHGRLGRRHSDAADGNRRSPRHFYQERHLAAQSEAAQFGDTSGQHCRHARIYGIAALREDPVAGLHFEVVRGAHHLMNAADRRRHGGRRLCLN